jgi:pyridoxal phosphate enzyme (YggS family)
VIDPAVVAANVAQVRHRIEAAGGRNVTLIAVTKGFGSEAVAAVRAAGVHDLGESYAQELLERRHAFAGTRVHFIGRLQTNKVKVVAPLVDCWQSVDRVAVATEIARRTDGATVMLQVNVTGESTKGGCEPSEAGALADRCRGLGLRVQGLMAVGSSAGAEASRPGFARLRNLVDELGLDHCSMGMSEDLEVAVQEGATMVRIGSALFGPRPGSKPTRRVLSE